MTGPHLSILNAGLDQLSMTTTPTVIPPSATDDANLDSIPHSNAQPPIQPTSLLNSTKGSPAQQPVGSPALFGLGPIASLDSLPEESMVGAQVKPQEMSMEHLYQMQIMAQKNQLQAQGQGVGLPTPPPQPQAIPAPLAIPQAGSPFHIPLQQGPVPVVASSMSLNLGASPRIAYPAVQGYHYPLSEGYQLPQAPDGLVYREGAQGELVPFFSADPSFGNRTGERGEVLVGGELPELLALPPPPQTPAPVAVPPPPSHAPKPYQHPNNMDPLSIPPPANPAAVPTGGELSPSPKGSSGKGQKPGKPKKQKGLSRLFSSNKGYQPPPRPPMTHEPTFLPSKVAAYDEGFDAGYEAGYKAAMAELHQQHQDIAQNLKYEQY